jgi:hypothetical protein
MDGLSPGGKPALRTLDPFAIEECISIGEAATIAGKTERTIRNWCIEHGIGRRIAGGRAKAAQGASGIDVNTGSAANVRTAIAKLGALDALTIRSNTARAVYGYEVAATSDEAQSQLLSAEAKQAGTAGDISALGTFLSSASSVGAKYAGMQTGATPVPTQTWSSAEGD